MSVIFKSRAPYAIRTSDDAIFVHVFYNVHYTRNTHNLISFLSTLTSRGMVRRVKVTPSLNPPYHNLHTR